MTWTVQGNQKARKTMIKKFGSCEDVCLECDQCDIAAKKYSEYMIGLAAKGGAARVQKGLSMTYSEVIKKAQHG